MHVSFLELLELLLPIRNEVPIEQILVHYTHETCHGRRQFVLTNLPAVRVGFTDNLLSASTVQFSTVHQELEALALKQLAVQLIAMASYVKERGHCWVRHKCEANVREAAQNLNPLRGIVTIQIAKHYEKE